MFSVLLKKMFDPIRRKVRRAMINDPEKVPFRFALVAASLFFLSIIVTHNLQFERAKAKGFLLSSVSTFIEFLRTFVIVFQASKPNLFPMFITRIKNESVQNGQNYNEQSLQLDNHRRIKKNSFDFEQIPRVFQSKIKINTFVQIRSENVQRQHDFNATLVLQPIDNPKKSSQRLM